MKSQVSKQTLDRNLFFFGGLVTLILTVSAILNLSNTSNFFTLILFLPVILYFGYLGLVRLRKNLKVVFNLNLLPHRYFGEFSFREFLLQTEWPFLVSLLLLSFAFFLIMLKASLSLI